MRINWEMVGIDLVSFSFLRYFQFLIISFFLFINNKNKYIEMLRAHYFHNKF